jgi:adenylylsulfate kinase-like enzyme
VKEELVITVNGVTISGKSRISYIIKKALEEYGVECTVIDNDYRDNLDFEMYCSKHLGEAMDVISKKTKVTIKQNNIRKIL